MSLNKSYKQKPKQSKMEYDTSKIDEVTPALLYLVTFKVGPGYSVWKGFDWETMNRLHAKSYVSNPKSKAKSVGISKEAVKLSKELFQKYFGFDKES